MKTVSFVIPCYRSEKTIEGVVREIEAAAAKEIFIDDEAPELVNIDDDDEYDAAADALDELLDEAEFYEEDEED